MKIRALGFDKLLESVFCLLLVVEAFSLKESCQDAWRSGSRLVRGQVNMMDEAILCSSIHSTFEALVVQCMVWRCRGEELGPVCWSVSAEALQISLHFIDLLSILLRYNGFTRIQKAVVDQMGGRSPNSYMTLLWVQVWLCKVLWSFFSVRPLSWLSYKIHFS